MKHVCILTSVHTVWDGRIYELQARTLAEAGYRVTLIATEVETQAAPLENVSIIGLKKPAVRLGRALNWRPFYTAALQTEADIYHFHDPDLLFVGWWLTRTTGKPVIYDRHEDYPDDILYNKEWLPKPLRWATSRLFKGLELWLAARLAAVIVTVDEHLAYFDNGVAVHNYPRLADFLTLPTGARDPHKLIYTGGLGEAYGIQTLIAMLAHLRDRPVHLDVFGHFRENEAELKVERLLTQHQPGDQYRFHGRIPYHEVQGQLVTSLAGFIALQDIPAFYTLYPRKMFEYMACELPIIASNLKALGQVIRQADCGLLVEPDNPAAFAEAVCYLLDQPEEATRLGQNGRRAVLERYNWERESQVLLDLYQSLLD